MGILLQGGAPVICSYGGGSSRSGRIQLKSFFVARGKEWYLSAPEFYGYDEDMDVPRDNPQLVSDFKNGFLDEEDYALIQIPDEATDWKIVPWGWEDDSEMVFVVIDGKIKIVWYDGELIEP